MHTGIGIDYGKILRRHEGNSSLLHEVGISDLDHGNGHRWGTEQHIVHRMSRRSSW